MTDDNIESATKKQVAEILPELLSKTLQEYRSFMDKTTQEEADKITFSKKQSSGKVAVAHIMLLLKLAKWAQVEGDPKVKDDLAKAIINARQELENYHSLENTDEFEDDDLE